MLINVNACRIKVSAITVGGIEREPLPSDEPADDLFALLLDLVEEGEDKCVRQPDTVPYEFLSLAAHLSATFLPAHHNYRIKFLLCKLIFGHEESEVLEEFGRLNVPLQLLMTRFAARDGVPFHTTGRDMDDNVEWDIVRNWRLGNNMENWYMQVMLLCTPMFPSAGINLQLLYVCGTYMAKTGQPSRSSWRFWQP